MSSKPHIESPRKPTRYRGTIESVGNGHVTGWIASVPDRAAALPVGLFYNGRLLALRSTGPGHAFALPLGDEQVRAIVHEQGELSVRVMDGSLFEIGRLSLADLSRNNPRFRAGLIRSLIRPDLEIMAERLAQPAPVAKGTVDPQRNVAYNGLFRGSPSSPLATAYLEFVLGRHGVAARDDIGDLPSALDWYLSTYGVERLGRRIPLSRTQIEYLNEPVRGDRTGFELSRFTRSKLAANAYLAGGIGAGGEAWYHAVLYWWCAHHVANMHLEDCLVPDWYVHRLRSIRSEWNVPEYPLSVFMEHWFLENPQARFLDLGRADDRLAFSGILLVKAVERPDFLRYIPQANIDALLDPRGDQGNAFSSLLSGLGDSEAFETLDRARYLQLLKSAGYDPSTDAFATVTPLGHRVEAAGLPLPRNETPVDIQVIGPTSKASGLGQAARLSAEILGHTPFSVNTVDFTLDDPARDNPGGPPAGADYARSRINLIHLNADNLPAVFAYAPDVFTDAWNIGYFFWELDAPADCDALAFSLLDEIWVASDFGVSIYSGPSGLPVTRAGMCFEARAMPDRSASRRALEQRLGLAGDEFVFLVAFDSFSFIQRKNPLGTLDAFSQAFPADPAVRLLVKTQNRSRVTDPLQLAIWAEVERRVSTDPRIVLVDETLAYDSFLQLKQAADCYVSLHRSEGWGFGMIEAMNLGVPVICTAYSGNMDFCSDATAWLVDYKLVPVAPGDYVYARDHHRWAEPDVSHAARQMRAVRSDAKARVSRTTAARRNVQDNFSTEAISVTYRRRIEEILASRNGA